MMICARTARWNECVCVCVERAEAGAAGAAHRVPREVHERADERERVGEHEALEFGHHVLDARADVDDAQAAIEHDVEGEHLEKELRRHGQLVVFLLVDLADELLVLKVQPA